jgi:uncharacterized protein YutE (UPF0331/DUF86 family)
VVVREEALAERLALLRSTVVRLRAAAGRELDDDWDEWALERGLQLAAQALFDVGNHVLAGAFGVRPRDYAEVPPELARKGVITDALARRLEGLAGFRNLLVHDTCEWTPRACALSCTHGSTISPSLRMRSNAGGKAGPEHSSDRSQSLGCGGPAFGAVVCRRRAVGEGWIFRRFEENCTVAPFQKDM